MSFETIRIERALPVINGFVQIYSGQNVDKTRYSVDTALYYVTGSSEARLSIGSGSNTGSKFGAQRIFKLPAVAVAGYSTDPLDGLP
jgi:hypothetical protein